MTEARVECGSCGRSFVPQLSFQTVVENGQNRHFCSQACRNPALRGERVNCSVCGTAFVPTLAVHVVDTGGGRAFLCSESCRLAHVPAPAVGAPMPPARAIAVINQKGGTAKTTTALSVAAGLGHLGKRTLLIDLDPQGNVGVSLGLASPRMAHHVILGETPAAACVVQAREGLDVITANQGLAAAEIELARMEPSERYDRLARVLADLQGYEYVVVDCAPALSILNQNALAYAGEVLIPVSCDYLALVGVRQVLRTLQRAGERLGRTIRVAGVLPTFYDSRNRVSAEVVSYLRKTFGARTLPPVRRNVKLVEAPSFNKTIFEHAPDSHGARDYIRVVEWLRTGEGSTQERAA